jgi:hypothetical protein
MKKNTSILLLLLFVSFACNESTTEPPINNDSSGYFPNSDGNYYYYNVSVYDTSRTLLQSGSRKSYFDSDTIIASMPFQVKVDSFQLSGLEYISTTYFRKNSTGVFNWVEVWSNGFYYLLPDSLRGGYSFVNEYRMLYNPPEVNQNWLVFKVNVNLLYLEFEFFKVEAEVLSRDTLTISFQNTTRNVEAFKIKYIARLTTSLNEPPKLFEVQAWIAKGIGAVKWEGNSEIINFFAGAEIYPINTIVLEELELFKVN